MAVEADWPDATRIDRYVRHRAPARAAEPAFQRFPTWIWRNAEVLAFLDWLRDHNGALPPERRTAFRGLDVYSLGASIDAVLAYLTLQALLRAADDGAKAVVWAHNSHIGNAAATAMGWQGEFNIGELCRTAYGEEAALIGFGTDRGTVAAADDWGDEMKVKTVVPARPDSYEHAFRRAGRIRSLSEWRDPQRRELAEALREPLFERAIGVVYRPQSEFLSHYFEAVSAEQFDAFVWFEETHAVTPLAAPCPLGAPETYPFGL